MTDAMIEEIVKNGEKAGVPRDEKLLTPIVPSMKMQIKALMARDIWDMNEMYMILNADNKILNEAVKALKDGDYEKKLEIK